MKITPAHDPNDFQTGKRHNLEFINVFDDNGNINGNGTGQFAGQPRFKASCEAGVGVWPLFRPRHLRAADDARKCASWQMPPDIAMSAGTRKSQGLQPARFCALVLVCAGSGWLCPSEPLVIACLLHCRRV